MSDIVERLKAGVREIGLADDNNTELFDIEDANETMSLAADTITRLQAELSEARESKDRLMIAAAASVKGLMDEYKRGHADGEKTGRDKAAEIVRDEVYAEAHDTEWDTGFNYAKSMAIRALKSPKPPIL